MEGVYVVGRVSGVREEKSPLKRHRRLLPRSPIRLLLSFPSQQLIFQHATNIFANRSGGRGGRQGHEGCTHAPNSGSARHVLRGAWRGGRGRGRGREESWSWRSCHYSGREGYIMFRACPTLPLGWSLRQFESMSLLCHLNACTPSLQRGRDGEEPREPRAHVRGICAFIKCGCGGFVGNGIPREIGTCHRFVTPHVGPTATGDKTRFVSC